MQSMRRITFLVLMLFLSCSAFADAVSDREKDALVKIYHATNGADWKIKWDLSLSVSTWFGVEINSGKVVGLNLSDNNLKGGLPDALSNLINLKIADFSSNKISGELPTDIGNLEHLEILSLFNNQIEGSLPGSLYEISTLKTLLLNNNKLSGSLSNKIRNFNSLENLSLFDNKFTGEIPKDLENLQYLSEMNLSYNQFEGTVSKKIVLLDSLNMTMFDKDGNPFLLEINTEKEIIQ